MSDGFLNLGLAAAQDEKLETEQSRDLNADVVASLCREEMERIKFVLRSYLRTRLQKVGFRPRRPFPDRFLILAFRWKIESYTNFILSNRREKAKLSVRELRFAEA